ncbi:MAG: CBS domain-containing protein [Gammaproteobacteria bacterium]|nr:CBS domain-containing protein [Gammaproteobacteria bacterium]
MTYIIVGPGLRDNVSLENLFPLRTVEEVSPAKKVEELDKPVSADLAEHQAHAKQAQQTYRATAELSHEREKAIYASQIMTNSVVTVSDKLLLSAAWNLLEEHEFRHLPVISENDGLLVGMVTEHDFMMSATDIGGLPPLINSHAQIQFVSQLMSSPILSASIDTDIHELAKVMYERHIGAVPILDKQGELAGIITHRDILKALVKTEPLELWI